MSIVRRQRIPDFKESDSRCMQVWLLKPLDGSSGLGSDDGHGSPRHSTPAWSFRGVCRPRI